MANSFKYLLVAGIKIKCESCDGHHPKENVVAEDYENLLSLRFPTSS